MTDDPGGNATDVVIAARDAADTIGGAVQSALLQPETASVIVVDDGSRDETARAAIAAADALGASQRLTVLRAGGNGPAAARNRAIASSHAPFVAVLDADDAFLPGRLQALHAARQRAGGRDIVADDIAFVSAHAPVRPGSQDVAEPGRLSTELTLAAFVDGNRTVRGRPRGELGFLKPVFSRAFLDRHALRYREDMRLGEDFDLLARALALGARMELVERVGYAALVRADSLSARHRTVDLERLWRACAALCDDPDVPVAARGPLRAHAREIEARWRHRLFLDERRSRGTLGAGLRTPARSLPAIAMAILRDKLGDRRQIGMTIAGRTLLTGRRDR